MISVCIDAVQPTSPIHFCICIGYTTFHQITLFPFPINSLSIFMCSSSFCAAAILGVSVYSADGQLSLLCCVLHYCRCVFLHLHVKSSFLDNVPLCIKLAIFGVKFFFCESFLEFNGVYKYYIFHQQKHFAKLFCCLLFITVHEFIINAWMV